jgi:hypothetical protein
MAAYASLLTIQLLPYMTGKSLRLQFITAADVNVGAELTATFTEIGNGFYLWSGNIPQTGLLAYKVREVGQTAILSVGTVGMAETWGYPGTELSAVPGPGATMEQMLEWLLALARNKRTQTATTELVLKDDGTTTLATSTKSDDGTTFARGEYS